MDKSLLASISQGEAGGLGPIGMMAVALSLHCRIWQHGHDQERIAAEYCGRAEPGPVALLLAGLVVERRLPDNPAYYCMGHGPDVIKQGFKWGDWWLMDHSGTMGLHLYTVDNVPWETEVTADGK